MKKKQNDEDNIKINNNNKSTTLTTRTTLTTKTITTINTYLVIRKVLFDKEVDFVYRKRSVSAVEKRDGDETSVGKIGFVELFRAVVGSTQRHDRRREHDLLQGFVMLQ